MSDATNPVPPSSPMTPTMPSETTSSPMRVQIAAVGTVTNPKE